MYVTNYITFPRLCFLLSGKRQLTSWVPKMSTCSHDQFITPLRSRLNFCRCSTWMGSIPLNPSPSRWAGWWTFSGPHPAGTLQEEGLPASQWLPAWGWRIWWSSALSLLPRPSVQPADSTALSTRWPESSGLLPTLAPSSLCRPGAAGQPTPSISLWASALSADHQHPVCTPEGCFSFAWCQQPSSSWDKPANVPVTWGAELIL